MSFGDYRRYSIAELKQVFPIQSFRGADLFKGFESSDRSYAELQADVEQMKFRIGLSKSDNEATRGSLLVAHVLWKASSVYDLGIFFEPTVEVNWSEASGLPHSLNGKYDCALCLDQIDFIAPIIAVVEVKRSSLADGVGQCVAEMYATLKQFQQTQVYGIVTDGEIWSFFQLQQSSQRSSQSSSQASPNNQSQDSLPEVILLAHGTSYYVNRVGDIVDRIGYIADQSRSKP